MVLCCELAAFMEWKHRLEMKTMTTFVKARKDNTVNNCIRRSYYCSRSGRKWTTGRGIRHSRVQGSCKIGSFCPAAIFARIANTGMFQFLLRTVLFLVVQWITQFLWSIYVRWLRHLIHAYLHCQSDIRCFVQWYFSFRIN